MSIMDMIRKGKEEFKQRRKEKAAQKAVYAAHPELELKDLKAQQAVLKQKADLRAERSKLEEMKKAERKEKIRAVVGFFGAPTQKAAQKTSKGKPVNERAMNSVFELGKRDKEDRFAIGTDTVRKEMGYVGKKRRGPFQ